MDIDFETYQPCSKSEELRNGGKTYRSSLSALENAWGHVASTKENLDTVDRRITKAKNYLADNDYDAGRKTSNKMLRKYSERKNQEVQLNLNPEIKYHDREDVEELLTVERDPLRPRRYPMFGERSPRSTIEQYDLDFQYDPDDDPFSERLRSPVIPKLNTSIGGRSLGASIRDSGSLARLRHKIKQQKENAQSPEMQAPFAVKVNHGEEDPVIAKDLTPREPMKRKVASMSAAPAYKGFNLPEAKDKITQTNRLADVQSRKLITHQQRKERIGSTQSQFAPGFKSGLPGNKKVTKKTGKNSPGKMQRIVAQRKPVPSITTTSWRLGQEAVKKVLGNMKSSKERKQEVGKIESVGESRNDDLLSTEIRKISDSEPVSESKESSTASKFIEESSEAARTNQSTSNGITDSRASIKNQDEVTEMKTDKDDDEDLKNISRDLSMHDDLPEEAKSMLAELHMDASDDSDVEAPKSEVQQDPVKQKNSTADKKTVKRKAPSPIKDKNDQDNYSRPKIRHYDQQDVQNYMAKQLAERKKNRLKEKRRQQQLKLEQEKKLMELYKKQKTSLKASLAPKRKNLFGSTFASQDKSEKASSNQSMRRQKQAETITGRKYKPICGSKCSNQNRVNELVLCRETPINTAESVRRTKEISQRVQNNLLADTAMNKLAVEDLKGSHLTSSSPEISHSPSHSRASLTYDISSPIRPHDEENLNETGEIDSEFKDSLEFDTSGHHLGIRSIIVKKNDREADKLPNQGPVRSVEDEVRELVEKYKAKIQGSSSKPERLEKASKVSNGTRTKEERIAAISATANSLRERIAAEASRLDNLRMLSKREKSPPPQPSLYSGFRGLLPGVGNIDEQAGLNQELKEKEEAATKIQAAFRGHTVRQGLDWRLPSGKSFGASLRDAREQSKQAILKASVEESSRTSSTSSYTSTFEAGSDVSLLSEETGSTASLIDASGKLGNEPRRFEAKEYTRPKFRSLKSGRHSKFTEAPRDSKDLKSILKQGGGDRYSVINILERRLKEANRQVTVPKYRKTKPSSGTLSCARRTDDKDRLSNTEDEIYEQDFEDAEYDTSTSTVKTDVFEDGRSSPLSDKLLTAELSRKSPQRTHSNEQSYSKSGKTNQEINSDDDPDKTLTLFQEDLHDNETSVNVVSYVSGQESAFIASAISPPESPQSLTEGSVDLEKRPVMTSTLRQPADQSEIIPYREQSDDSMTTSMNSLNQISDKFSPGTLERRLRAEVNQLETMDDALRQVTDIERVRGISLAQQETVSLAQMLKARQLGYQQELEKMSQMAREQAIGQAKELEKVQEAAVKSAESASKTIAEVRKEATDAITQSKRKCEEVHEEANKRAEKAAMEVENAQKMATGVILESANRYSSNIETLATSAASAAASSAVQTALQIHKEQLEELRKEALNKVSRSYSRSTISTTSTRSSSKDTTLTKSPSVDQSLSYGKSYADEEFEDASPEKSSVTDRPGTASISNQSSTHDISTSIVNATDKSKSFTQSISEEVFEQNSYEAKSRTASNTPVISKKSYEDVLEESLQPSSDVDEKSFKFEDHLASSLTEDELYAGFRMVLPVVSHRRKSLEKDRRTQHDKQFSDNGTSSDDMKLTPRTIVKHASHSPFVGEDTFSEFTSGMVKQYLQEEEIRSKHQTALLKLREKALIEKTKAEMAWLELQKTSLKNKGADDLMPPLNKKQRGLLLKLQSDQTEIRRLKQAYRAASHERKFMLYQQKEILRLKQNTQKVWNKLGHLKATKKDDEIHLDEKSMENKSISEASSLVSMDQSSLISEDLSNPESQKSKTASQKTHSKTTSITPTQTLSSKKDNLSSDSAGEIQEEIPTEQISESKDHSSFPSYDNSPKSSKTTPERRSQDRKTTRTQTPAEDVTISERTESSMITDLKKLRKKASEEYLLKREKTLRERQNQFQSVIQKQNEMSGWQKRIEKEEMRLKSEIKRALDKTKTRIATPSLSASKRSNEDSSESNRKSQETSSQSTTIQSSKEKSSGSDTSITEDLKTASIETDSEMPLESIASMPGSLKKTPDTSIADDYVDDTFESPTATQSQYKKVSLKSNRVPSSSSRTPSSRRYAKESDESRSEEDTVADVTSDASDIEKRIRQLEDELIHRRKDLERIRKKRDKDQLRKKEQRLKQELQAVESLISIENKENVNDRSINDANSFIKGSVSPKILSPKILQQSNVQDQNTSKKVKDNATKARIESKDTDESQQDSEQLSRKSHTKSITDDSERKSRRSLELASQVSKQSQTKSISEELDVLKKIKDVSDEEKASLHGYDYDDFESERSRGSAKEESVSKSLQESESILSEIEEKPDDSTVSEIQTEISPFERSDIESQRKDSQHRSLSYTSPRSATPETDLSERTQSRYRSDEVRTELSKSKTPDVVTASLKEKLKFSNVARSSESIHSLLESIDSDRSGSERLEYGSRSSKKDSKGGDDIYDDDFFDESASSVVVKSNKSTDSKVVLADAQASDRQQKEKRSITEDRSVISESIKTAIEDGSAKSVSSAVHSRSSQSDTKQSNGLIDQSTSALSKYDLFQLNSRVVIDNTLKGTIRFIGKTSFSPVVVAGIELDEKLGNTDGSFRGKRYFNCPADFGLFSPVKNIALCTEREQKISSPSSVEEVDDIVSERLDVSELEDNVSKSSEKLEVVLKSLSIKEGSQKQRSSLDEKEQPVSRDYSGEQSYTDRDISYDEDFEDDADSKHADSKRQQLSSQTQSKSSIAEEIVSEDISAHTDISKSIDRSIKNDKASPILTDLLDVRVHPTQRKASLTESETETSDDEVVPHPPRLDLDKIADSVTESLLKKLIVESLQINRPETDQGDLSISKQEPIKSQGSISSEIAEGDLSIGKGRLKSNLERKLSDGDVSEDESFSERSDDTIKRMTVGGTSGQFDREAFEVSEAYITPSVSNASTSIGASDKEKASSTVSRDGDFNDVFGKEDLTGIDIVQQKSRKPGFERDMRSERTKRNADKEVETVTKELLNDAISHMISIMYEKQTKLSTDTQTQDPSIVNQSNKQHDHSSPILVNVIVKNKDGVVISEIEPESPPEPRLDDAPLAFDTDLLAAKLSELKKMDQEIDDLLGEDSEEDEPFALPGDRDILQISDDETDLIPPVRGFDFGEPVIYVPHTVPDIYRLVSDSANTIISKMVHSEDYEKLSPSDSYLHSDTDNSELEHSSNMLYRKMIFDVTKDLFKEGKEFKSIQNVAKQPWAKPSRRVFAKFIRQIHNLTGQELIKSLQKHVCVCLGLEEGRPSLDVLKKRLPLNTAKKDYIDALLVEELREEEPQWVNYDEDEQKVKEQLTQGILDNLIDETIELIKDIYNKRNHLEDLV